MRNRSDRFAGSVSSRLRRDRARPNEVVACALFAINGYASTMWNVVTVSLRQQIVPGELFGRVNSVYRMIGWGLLPVGAITGGFVADAFGLRAPYLLGGITIAIAAVAVLPALVHPGPLPSTRPMAINNRLASRNSLA